MQNKALGYMADDENSMLQEIRKQKERNPKLFD